MNIDELALVLAEHRAKHGNIPVCVNAMGSGPRQITDLVLVLSVHYGPTAAVPINERPAVPYVELLALPVSRPASRFVQLAKDAGIQSARVKCASCGTVRDVDGAQCLATGWPLCCGLTMSLVMPKK